MWAELRTASREFLERWEPTWPQDALSRAAYRRRLRRQVREGNDGVGYAFFIFRRKDAELVGGITLSNLQRGAAQSGAVGYWIGKPHARNGYMTEAMHCVLRHCFGRLGLYRVDAACMPSNEASQALLRRCGFRREGYARNFLKINGAWRDHLLFAMLANEYEPPPGWAEATRGHDA
jgi:ribosomal-protein-alanine N-acetyltransferase